MRPACVRCCRCCCCCRNLLDSYYLGRVIGAGSFGVVREGIKVATGKRFAVKTVSKVPKRGAPTPRWVCGGLYDFMCLCGGCTRGCVGCRQAQAPAVHAPSAVAAGADKPGSRNRAQAAGRGTAATRGEAACDTACLHASLPARLPFCLMCVLNVSCVSLRVPMFPCVRPGTC